MASHRLTLRPSPSAPCRTLSTPSHVAFSSREDILAALWETGYLELWNLNTRLEFGRGPVMMPDRLWSGSLDSAQFREISVRTNASGDNITRISALGFEKSGTDVLHVLDIEGESINAPEVPTLGSLGWRLAIAGGTVIHRNGKVHECTLVSVHAVNLCLYILLLDDSESKQLTLRADFGTTCDVVRSIDMPESPSLPETCLYISLTRSGTLSSTTPSSPVRTLAQNANSFTVSGDLVVYTTLAHEAHFVPASLIATVDAGTDVGGERRRVERGSRIVTSIPSAMSLVLQMPRGNLETVNPRPMVMVTIQADIDEWVFIFMTSRIVVTGHGKG
jgi:elongator complex protein 1